MQDSADKMYPLFDLLLVNYQLHDSVHFFLILSNNYSPPITNSLALTQALSIFLSSTLQSS